MVKKLSIRRACEILGFGQSMPRDHKILRQRYQALAHRFHPDKPQGSHDKMSEVTMAYRTLLPLVKGRKSVRVAKEDNTPDPRAAWTGDRLKLWLPWQRRTRGVYDDLGEEKQTPSNESGSSRSSSMDSLKRSLQDAPRRVVRSLTYIFLGK